MVDAKHLKVDDQGLFGYSPTACVIVQTVKLRWKAKTPGSPQPPPIK
jgi:hypothetical protein